MKDQALEGIGIITSPVQGHVAGSTAVMGNRLYTRIEEDITAIEDGL